MKIYNFIYDYQVDVDCFHVYCVLAGYGEFYLGCLRFSGISGLLYPRVTVFFVTALSLYLLPFNMPVLYKGLLLHHFSTIA